MHTEAVKMTATMKAWGITRSFGSGDTKIYALRNVSLELYPGQIALLMGPFEIAQLDNDPNYPEDGLLVLDVRGGR